MIYLDYAATTPPSETVIEAVTQTLRDYPGNPSSFHRPGREAKKRYQQAKRHIATLLGTIPERIFFTGSGSEATALALKGHPFTPGETILTTTVEHHATLHTLEQLKKNGIRVRTLPCDHEGFLPEETLEAALAEERTGMLSLVHANNEIGTLQDLKALGDLAHAHDVKVHADMVQSPLHMQLALDEMPVDYASFSAHKFFGPKGIGILYARDVNELTPLIDGGGQEHGLRSGTENLPYIVGLEKALAEAVEALTPREAAIRRLAKRFLWRLEASTLEYNLNGPPLEKPRLWNILNIGFKGVDPQRLAYKLDRHDIAVSLGSACSGDTIERSHVLEAIKAPRSHGALRFSLSHHESEEDIDDVVEVLQRLLL